MGPKIFISSTFYDLKYVREDLAHFVADYRYEPVMFERGDIGYVPGEPLDSSCYHDVSHSDMVILVVGGEYGSPATGETRDDDDKFKEYLSITRKEFAAAMEAEIPVYVFIISEVYAEYQVYAENKESIERKGKAIKFYATKNINVFRFISSIKDYKNVVINTFQRTSDIKDYMANQWARYMSLYLELRREKKKEVSIVHTLTDITSQVEQLNLMVEEMGKKILGSAGEEAKEYSLVKIEQAVSEIKNIIISNISFVPLYEDLDGKRSFMDSMVDKIVEMMKDRTFYLSSTENPQSLAEFDEKFSFENAVITLVNRETAFKLDKYKEMLPLASVQTKLKQELAEEKSFGL
ncbi:MAG: DUF4062 domain-containing protein [Blautia sp.]|nr:DUF4062 domain-containing protein [Blautia sp.]